MKRIFKKLIDRSKISDVNRLPGAIVLMLITVVITALLQNCFWVHQNNIEHERDVRQIQYQIITELVDKTTKIEALREKIYWNEYWGQLDLLLDESSKDWDIKYSYAGIEETLKRHDDLEIEYREQYENTVSSYKASLVKSQLYFDVNQDQVALVESALYDVFNFDFGYIEEQYRCLIKTKIDVEELLSTLEELAEQKYNKIFYNNSYQYIYILKNLSEE